MAKDRINSKSGFSDPARIKNQRPPDEPVDGRNSPWDFRCPQYDQRTGPFVNAGTIYGVGVAPRVGHKGPVKVNVDALPTGKVNTMTVDET